ncbi:MAG TPA: hypothetical protein VEW07_11760 [Solirubrobacterales bacterium]|nr:hypothetical protein [Solirubrobacterales bacterium]
MMGRHLTAALLATALVFSGCGGDADSSATNANPDALLVKANDLLGRVEVGPPPFEKCDPLPILEGKGGRTAVVGGILYVGVTRLSEAVGVFAGEAQATAAFKTLSGPKMLECIHNSFDPKLSIDAVGAQPLDLGDESAAARYKVNGEESESLGYLDAVTIRTGPCVASVLVRVDSPTAGGAVSAQLSETVADRLADGC